MRRPPTIPCLVSTADSCIVDGSPVLVNPETFQALCAEYKLQHFSIDHPAELLAVRVLQSKTVTMSTFAELIPLLPAEVRPVTRAAIPASTHLPQVLMCVAVFMDLAAIQIFLQLQRC